MLDRNPSARSTKLWQRFFSLLVVTAPLRAQYPPIGSIDYYGLRRVSQAAVRKALALKVGDRVPDSFADAEARLRALPGVRAARLNPVCCAAGKAMLYVGIEEAGAPSPHFHDNPKGDVALPQEIIQANQDFDKAWEKAVLKGDAGDDVSQGHSLMANPECRAIQERFLVHAARDLAILRTVLRSSANAEQRAVAAWVIGYAPDKRLVVKDLEYALEDPNEEVRNNACRALYAISALALRRPESDLHISPEPAIALLNSLAWTDRNKASLLLENLSSGRDPKLLESLRAQALPALIEMARWKNPGHAYPAWFVLGCVAGLPHKEIEGAWQRGDREFVISAAQRQRASKTPKTH